MIAGTESSVIECGKGRMEDEIHATIGRVRTMRTECWVIDCVFFRPYPTAYLVGNGIQTELGTPTTEPERGWRARDRKRCRDGEDNDSEVIFDRQAVPRGADRSVSNRYYGVWG